MTRIKFETAAILLDEADSVAVLKRPLQAGDELVRGDCILRAAEDIRAGHKIAVEALSEGAPVRKYGQVIGFARTRIGLGEHVHTHNLGTNAFERDCQFGIEARPVDYYPPERMRTFLGYSRPGGRAGTRNYLAVVSTVNCSASVSGYVRDRFRTAEFKRDFPNVDGVVAFTHKAGCATDPGEPLEILQRVLAGMARHPNISGYVMVGLGCETNQVEAIRRAYALDQLQPGELAPSFLHIQTAGSVLKTVEAGVAALSRLLPVANALRRTPQPVSTLVLAENCGGSDANSGITANPALGRASDELVRYGGTSVLAETPELYGAEHLLVRRRSRVRSARNYWNAFAGGKPTLVSTAVRSTTTHRRETGKGD